MRSGQINLPAGRVHHHELIGIKTPRSGVHFLHLDDIAVGIELDVVDDTHRRHHEAHIPGDLAAQCFDLFGQPVITYARINQRQQAVSDLDPQLIHLEGSGDRLLRRRRIGCRFLRFLGHRLGVGLVPVRTRDTEGKRA